jgi:PilZ domain.
MDWLHKHSDRRLSRRVDVNLPLQIAGAGFHYATDTKNLSVSGLYCQLDRFIPLMTKLDMTMVIPVIIRNKKIKKEIICSAVLVRIEPETERVTGTMYHAGFFFTAIKDKDREIIGQYIQQSFSASNN